MATPHRLRHHAGALRVVARHAFKDLLLSDVGADRRSRQPQLESATLQALPPWRDPDSNRGHHDFQSCGLGRPGRRNSWKQRGLSRSDVGSGYSRFASVSAWFRRWLRAHLPSRACACRFSRRPSPGRRPQARPCRPRSRRWVVGSWHRGSAQRVSWRTEPSGARRRCDGGCRRRGRRPCARRRSRRSAVDGRPARRPATTARPLNVGSRWVRTRTRASWSGGEAASRRSSE
jgi:hypothetical protein